MKEAFSDVRYVAALPVYLLRLTMLIVSCCALIVAEEERQKQTLGERPPEVYQRCCCRHVAPARCRGCKMRTRSAERVSKIEFEIVRSVMRQQSREARIL